VIRISPEHAADAAARRDQVAPSQAKTEVKAMDRAVPGEPSQVALDVPDIHCAGCEHNIEGLLRDRDGVDTVKADARTRRYASRIGPSGSGFTRSKKRSPPSVFA
jgi:hypothetical protein